MRAVMALAERVLVLHHGAAIAEGTPEAVVREPAVVQVLSRRGGGRLMLRVEHLDVFHGDAQALDGVSLEIGEGAIVAIVGANGAGKTSLIRTIAGMHRPARGRIVFRDTDIARLGEPSRLQSRHRPGGGRPADVSDAVGRGEPRHGRDAAARPRRTGAEISSGCWRCFPCSPSARGRRRARFPAASSRCWPSAAA